MNSTEKTEYTLLHVEDSPELQEWVRHILTSRPSIKIIAMTMPLRLFLRNRTCCLAHKKYS